MSGAGGGGGAAGGTHVRTGKSAGCDKPPPGNDSSQNYVKHDIMVGGLDPVYLKGGMYYQSSGNYDFSNRPYSVRLPANYDPSKPYAVTFGGGGCGGNAAGSNGGGLQIAPNGATIQVGLIYINGCFNDGGPSIGNRADTPEEPYFRAVMAQMEKDYCIDLSQVFVSGFSSGAWEAYTLGCAASDLVRGISADEGGFRTMHPACKGPVAAVLVAGDADTENPIGPLDPNNANDKGAIGRLGSLGSAPGRDDILARNGCAGTATATYEDAKYGQCKKYTGCPAAYPVIWCQLPGVGHNNSSYGGVNYSPGPMWDVLGKLPPP
jgi:poly(3-hydroxybutyrate) depolymerase